jgi:hypothetical protein
MDNSNREGAGATGRDDRTKSRQLALGVIVGLLAVSYGATQWINRYRDNVAKKSLSEYSAFMADVSKVDAILEQRRLKV